MFSVRKYFHFRVDFVYLRIQFSARYIVHIAGNYSFSKAWACRDSHPIFHSATFLISFYDYHFMKM